MKRSHSNNSLEGGAGARCFWWVLGCAMLFLVFFFKAGAMAQTVTWDSNTTGTGTDGAGTWNTTSANWITTGTTHTTWSNTAPDNAIIGVGGNGGTITLGTNISVGNITFATVNASHPYTITGNSLILAPTSTVTTNSSATIASVLDGAGTAFIKAGTGTLTVTASSAYTGATIVNAGTLLISGGINTINFNSSSSLTINNGGTVSLVGDNSLWGYGTQIASKVTTINTGGTLTINVGQNTAHMGPIVMAGGTLTSTGTPANSGSTYGSYNFDYGVTAGGTAATSVMSATEMIPSEAGGTIFNVKSGATNGIDLNVTGSLANSTGIPDTGIIKTGDGVMQLAGTDTYAGTTTIKDGTLALNYSTNNTNKLSNTAVLYLSGGALSITGGSVTETVGSTTLSSGNQVTRVSGSTVLQFGTLTRLAGATLTISASNITTTSTQNTNGILGTWATINGTAYALNSTNGTNGPITALSTYGQTVTRLSSGTKSITNSATNNVQLSEGTGTAGNITLGSATTAINSLTVNSTGGVATIDPAGKIFRTGGILVTPTSGGLTIGTGTNNGTLTASSSGGELVTQNFSTHNLTINSVIADNGTASSLTTGGTGSTVLTGTNTYTGATTVSQGTLTLSGTGSLANTSQVAINNGGTLMLSSSATSQINSVAGITLNGGTLALGTASTSGQLGALTLSSSSTIDFGSGGGSTITFANSSASTWDGTSILSVYNWTPGVDHLYFGNILGGGLPAGALSQIVFYTDDGHTLATTPGSPTSYGPGNGEISPVPEPSTLFAGLCLLSLVGYKERRWVLRCQAARQII